MILWCSNLAFGQDENLYITTNTLVARPLGMGGAYMAVEDELAAGLYNPANAGGYRFTRGGRFKLFLNPLTPTLAFADPSTFFERSHMRATEVLSALSFIVKGMTLNLGALDVALIAGEQATKLNLLPGAAFDTKDYLDNHYHLLALRLRIAERVAFGGSLGLFFEQAEDASRISKLRASYGITLAPSREVLVGVSYVTLPMDEMGSYRNHPERLLDGSLNLGVSYRPFRGTTLSADFRNLVEDSDKMVREPHFGFEQNFAAILALRLGAFYKQEDASAALTAGLGLLDLGRRFARGRENQPNWTINYGVVGERTGKNSRRFIHAMTVIFRL